MAVKKQSFEKAMERLEKIVDLMENPDISLGKSVDLYKEGIELSVYCSEILKASEKEVLELTKNESGLLIETEFEQNI